MKSSAAVVISQTSTVQKELQQNIASVSGSHRENWGESNMADASPRTDTSTDVDTDDKNQRVMSLAFIIQCLAAKGKKRSCFWRFY